MKIYCWLILGLVFAGFSLTGCATAPLVQPKPSGGIIYDQSGKPVYIPPSAQKPIPPMETPSDNSENETPKPSSPAEETTPETPKPSAPRMGGSVETSENNSSDEGYLAAAVTPLEDQARQEMAKGQLDRALTTTERAIRIDASNPALWNLMAQIQMKKENYSQAEQLARKSNLFAKNNTKLQRENWKIIVLALREQGKTDEAREALRQLRELEY